MLTHCTALWILFLLGMTKVLFSLLPAFSLTGNRDRGGRAVLQVCTRAQVWAGEACTVNNLTCLLGYYHSTLRWDSCLIPVIQHQSVKSSNLTNKRLVEITFTPAVSLLYSIIHRTDSFTSLRFNFFLY